MKKKILVIQPRLPYYRIAIFNRLCEKYDIAILHSGKKIEEENLLFDQIFADIKRVGPFFYLKLNLWKLCKNYDAIISEGNIRHIDRNCIILNPFRKFKWINWGIGVSADYNKKYDSDKKLDSLRYFLSKNSDANIFYSDYPKNKYIEAGYDKNNLFVANNTTEVSYNKNKNFKKKYLLFIGTLYRQKKIYELLNSYLKAFQNEPNKMSLIIIGDGQEYQNIKDWIQQHNQEESIYLKGAIFDSEILENYFRESFACISPGQAGLSVITSMGYGTPFITKKEAITGGEIFNIDNNVNGIIYNEDNELVNILLDIYNNTEKYVKMGINAREFYLKNRTTKQMVNGISNAIDYTFV